MQYFISTLIVLSCYAATGCHHNLPKSSHLEILQEGDRQFIAQPCQDGAGVVLTNSIDTFYSNCFTDFYFARNVQSEDVNSDDQPDFFFMLAMEEESSLYMLLSKGGKNYELKHIAEIFSSEAEPNFTKDHREVSEYVIRREDDKGFVVHINVTEDGGDLIPSVSGYEAIRLDTIIKR